MNNDFMNYLDVMNYLDKKGTRELWEVRGRKEEGGGAKDMAPGPRYHLSTFP